jgi:hypothetical protein
MNELSQYIKCRTTFFDKGENKLKFIFKEFYIKSDDIKAVYPPAQKQIVEGQAVAIFSVQTSFERLSVISEELENYFGHVP